MSWNEGQLSLAGKTRPNLNNEPIEESLILPTAVRPAAHCCMCIPRRGCVERSSTCVPPPPPPTALGQWFSGYGAMLPRWGLSQLHSPLFPMTAGARAVTARAVLW